MIAVLVAVAATALLSFARFTHTDAWCAMETRSPPVCDGVGRRTSVRYG